MQNHKLFKLQQLIIIIAIVLLDEKAVATLECPDCGKTKVPYPLSTSPNCGHQLYKVSCNAGVLYFNANNGSSYMITSVTPGSQVLAIGPKGLNKNSCIAPDVSSKGISLNESLPFTITNSNTVLNFNCTNSFVKESAMDCSSSSPCNAFMNSSEELQKCLGLRCCSYTTGGSKTDYRLDIADGSSNCTAYRSFVNLDASLPVTKWPETGLQIKWEKPVEPICQVPSDCQGLLNSTCSPDPAVAKQRRCFCNQGFHWDPINGICDTDNKCKGKKHCPHHISHKKLYQGLIFTACGIVIIIVFAVLVKQHQKHIKREAHRKLVKEREIILNSKNHGKAAKLYTGKEIKRSTNNFSKEHLLGEGGFGEVYKGILDDGNLSAIKRAKNGATLGMDQVLNEVCILCQVNHRGLVRLLGCCLDLDQPVLVYEYVPHGTLFEHLHGRFSNTWGTLTWERRLLIAKQTAEGLAYLHFSAVPPIFHRDIKSSNILLDEKLDAKVADFGLSRLVDTEGTHVSTCAQGTLGYLDPEYYQNYQLTDRSDVYSFGVVLLELLTSKKAIDFNRDDDVNLAIYVSNLANTEKLLDAVDAGLKTQASDLELETMKAFGLLAVACVDEQRMNRPSMREVSEEIEYIISILAKDSKTLL